MYTLPKQRGQRGFTIVELIVVIIVIGILVSIVVVSYGAWRKNVATSAVKSDLNGVNAAMENYRNFNNAYPTAPTFSGSGALFQSSDNITLTYGSGSDSTYCVQGQSTQYTTIIFRVTQSAKEPVSGACP
jgi:type IV pilus assembly protein PilA